MLVPEMVILLLVAIPIALYVFSKRLKRAMPPKFPAASVVIGWTMVITLALSVLFQSALYEAGHVLTVTTSVFLRGALAVVLARAYFLLTKQRLYTQSLVLLVAALVLWIPVLWLMSAPIPGSHNPMESTWDTNPAGAIAFWLGGSFFIWLPIRYLLRGETRQRYGVHPTRSDLKHA